MYFFFPFGDSVCHFQKFLSYLIENLDQYSLWNLHIYFSLKVSHWSGNNFALRVEKRTILAAFSKWRASPQAIFINNLLRGAISTYNYTEVYMHLSHVPISLFPGQYFPFENYSSL